MNQSGGLDIVPQPQSPCSCAPTCNPSPSTPFSTVRPARRRTRPSSAHLPSFSSSCFGRGTTFALDRIDYQHHLRAEGLNFLIPIDEGDFKPLLLLRTAPPPILLYICAEVLLIFPCHPAAASWTGRHGCERGARSRRGTGRPSARPPESVYSPCPTFSNSYRRTTTPSTVHHPPRLRFLYP